MAWVVNCAEPQDHPSCPIPACVMEQQTSDLSLVGAGIPYASPLGPDNNVEPVLAGSRRCAIVGLRKDPEQRCFVWRLPSHKVLPAGRRCRMLPGHARRAASACLLRRRTLHRLVGRPRSRWPAADSGRSVDEIRSFPAKTGEKICVVSPTNLRRDLKNPPPPPGRVVVGEVTNEAGGCTYSFDWAGWRCSDPNKVGSAWCPNKLSARDTSGARRARSGVCALALTQP